MTPATTPTRRGLGKRVAFVTASAALIGATGLAAPAAAFPDGCSSGRASPRTAYTICHTGSGEYRSWAVCLGPASVKRVNGPWRSVGSGQRSEASCQWGWVVGEYGSSLIGPI
ncbi:MAG TPA: hypothetical protein VES42_07255 [Pilimelia sp.]|nr:hypothetical protein [Pilimelia sp.]